MLLCTVFTWSDVGRISRSVEEQDHDIIYIILHDYVWLLLRIVSFECSLSDASAD